MTREEIDLVLARLACQYPEAGTELDFSNPFELLIATILSAQCTDRQVNKVTPHLFAQYPAPEDIACLSEETLGKIIHSCGFYRTKAKNIIKACKILVRDHGSTVPQDFEALQNLPGVGRKTANVVVSNAFGQPAIAVDTHVYRVANRIGIANAKNVLETEKQLMDRIPRDKWSRAHHWLIHHGRQVCSARKPACDRCVLLPWCNYGQEHAFCAIKMEQ